MGSPLRGRMFAALSLVAVLGATPVAAGVDRPDPAQAARWEPGVVIIALFPSLQPIDDVLAIVKDPTIVVERSRPLLDFVRVCGDATGIGDMVQLRFADDATVDRVLPRLQELPGVAFAQRSHLLVPRGHETGNADDPLLAQQWGIENTGQVVGPNALQGRAGSDARVKQAWAQNATGEGQVIAVLDEGMDISHPDLAPNIWVNEGETPDNGVDDDGNGWVDDVNGWSIATNSGDIRPMPHGTQVAGIAAARGDNSDGISGVAPDARIMPVDFIVRDLLGTNEAPALGAFAYAIANGATVINNSWGEWLPSGMFSPAMSAASHCAAVHGVTIAWAGGNHLILPQVFPGAYPALNSLATTPFRADGCPDPRSQSTPVFNDILSPGTDILTTGPDGSYVWFEGSSAAAPHLAGVMALVRERHPALAPTQVIAAIQAGARRTTAEPYSRSLGFLSAEGALRAAADILSGEVPGTSTDDSVLLRCTVQPQVDPLEEWVQTMLDRLP